MYLSHSPPPLGCPIAQHTTHTHVCVCVALQHVTKDIAGSMWWGMFPPAEVLYSAADYAVAIKLLLASPYGAVDQAVLLSQLPGGVPALTAMMKANLLALRPYSGEDECCRPPPFPQRA